MWKQPLPVVIFVAVTIALLGVRGMLVEWPTETTDRPDLVVEYQGPLPELQD